MTTTKRLLDLLPRPQLRLSEIERLIRIHRIIVPPLSRRALRELCEDGTFETADGKPSKMGWLVFEDSFLKWVETVRTTSKWPKQKC